MPAAATTSDRLRLILLSFLMLFVELVLIRWAGSNIVFLSYFSNFVLLGSFLGIGVGFLRTNKKTDLFQYAVVGLAALVGFVWLFPARVKIDPSEVPKYFKSPGATGLPIWVILPIVFVAVAAVMAMIGEGVARAFKKFEPLEAYRLDILGSLAGITAFSLMSLGSARPITWGIAVAAVFVWLSLPRLRWFQTAAIVVLLAVLGMQSFAANVFWSPYYKIEVRQIAGFTSVFVNGRPQQALITNADLKMGSPQYWLPYTERTAPTPPQDVLIIGAGTGIDTAVALSQNVGHVDAVEIDPGIYHLGLTSNPEHPFSDPRVSAYVTDGRAFLENSDKRYDLVLFAVPDSITLLAGNANVRLESYLYTKEAIQQAEDHLKPGGVFVMHNYFRQGFAEDRIAGTLQSVFGQSPCTHDVGEGGLEAVMLDSPDPGAIACTGVVWQRSPTTPPPVTDDRPFPYIEHAIIPAFYLLSLAVMLAVSFLAVRLTAGPLGQMRRYSDLFFMGAAFLLLETKNVAQFALWFGTTWFVNAFVFGGVLLTVLAAIEVAKRVELKRPGRLYSFLFVALAVAWAVPDPWLLSMPFGIRLVAAVAVAFTPVFLANLVFARRFKDVGASTIAFAANLLGAMVGGMLEYGAIMIGYRGLTIVAAALYALAWFSGARYLSPVEAA